MMNGFRPEWNESCKRMVSCRTPYCGDFGIYSGKDTGVKCLSTPEGARVLFDGRQWLFESAGVTFDKAKPPYPVNISFYTIAGKDKEFIKKPCLALVLERGEEYDDETNNQWYDRGQGLYS